MADSGSYFHGLHPLTVHATLDGLAGLKAVWAFMAGSPYVYPDKWAPHSATLYTSGSFTLGLDTSLGRTGTSRVINAVFGSGQNSLTSSAVTIGDGEPWVLRHHPLGCGTAWQQSHVFLFKDFHWPGAEAGPAWPEPPQSWTPWGDPALAGLPRPQPLGCDPLEAWLPPCVHGPVEEGSVLGWGFPLGAPSAAMPKRTG
jgi:hypothetical protein